MSKEINIKAKFDKLISKKDISVEDIERELFLVGRKERWTEILSLLKERAKESIKSHESKMSLLTLYWLRYEEQTSSKHYNPRESLFLNDSEIPSIIFEEGKKVLEKIGKGDYLKGNFEYLRYIIEALGNLEIDQTQSLNLLNAIRDCLYSLDDKNDLVQKLKPKIEKSLEKRR
jgi:hypothetical protein